jgi:hypothetical protein
MTLNDILAQFQQAVESQPNISDEMRAWATSREAAQAYQDDPMRVHYTPYVWLVYRVQKEANP